eukprot:3112229-Pyramimonas_sp.AAC.1
MTWASSGPAGGPPVALCGTAAAAPGRRHPGASVAASAACLGRRGSSGSGARARQDVLQGTVA